MNLIDDLKWRYAAKRLDNTKKIPQEKVDRILEAINLTPTSLGLQAFKVIVIEDKQLLNKIYNEACQQMPVKECSHLLIFAPYLHINDQVIDSFLDTTAKIRNMDDEWKEKYKGTIKYFQSLNKDRESEWLSHQTYIALGFACAAAANERVDSAIMEGFDRAKIDTMLGLGLKGLTTSLLMPLGYRDEANDPLANAPKVRKNTNKLVEAMTLSSIESQALY